MSKGRPKGSLNKTTRLIQDLLNAHAPEVAEKVVELAKAGDPNAVRIVMDRVSPPRTGAPVTWNMPTVRQAGDIPDAYLSLLQAVADGDLSPAEANQILPIVNAAAKAFDFDVDRVFEPDTIRFKVYGKEDEVDTPEQTSDEDQKDAA